MYPQIDGIIKRGAVGPRFVIPSIYGTGSIKIWTTRHMVSVDVRIFFQQCRRTAGERASYGRTAAAARFLLYFVVSVVQLVGHFPRVPSTTYICSQRTNVRAPSTLKAYYARYCTVAYCASGCPLERGAGTSADNDTTDYDGTSSRAVDDTSDHSSQPGASIGTGQGGQGPPNIYEGGTSMVMSPHIYQK